MDRGAGDRAFGTLSAVTELLHALRHEPARRLSRGGVALPDARRLGAAAGIDADEVELLLDIAARAGLADAGAEWSPSAASAEWLAVSRLERWSALARGWLERLPDELHELLRQRAHAVWGQGLLDYLGWLYPAGGTWIRERTTQAAREAELLGITGGSTPSTPGTALLVDGPEAATAAMAALFPHEVDKVYLQPDLSIIAPGPLLAPIDDRLRGMAEAETRGLASSYRMTAGSVTRALTAGETVPAIREFLSGISLTGIPQPLEYLLTDTEQRFGTLRVGAMDPGLADPDAPDAGAAAYVRSDDSALLGQLLVDPNLAPLAFRRVGEHRIVTRFDAAVLFWTLADARYPVVAEDAAGAVVVLRRERRAGSGTVAERRHRDDSDPAGASGRGRRAGGDQPGLARPPARARDPQQAHGHGRRPAPGRNGGRLPARAGRARQRAPARPRPPCRHRAHAAAVVDHGGHSRILTRALSRDG